MVVLRLENLFEILVDEIARTSICLVNDSNANPSVPVYSTRLRNLRNKTVFIELYHTSAVRLCAAGRLQQYRRCNLSIGERRRSRTLYRRNLSPISVLAVSTMNSKKNNPKVRGRKTLRQKTSQRKEIIYDSIPLVVPTKQTVRLGFEGIKTVTSATTEGSVYYYANGLYDIDPSVGNLTVIGFNQWMSLYNVFRVKRVTFIVTASNNEAFPVRIASCFFPQSTSSYLRSQWLNLHGREHETLGPLTGMGRTKFIRSQDLDRLIGVDAVKGDLGAYYGTTSSNPNSLMSFNLAAASMSASVLTNGVTFAVTAYFEVELSYPAQLAQV